MDTQKLRFDTAHLGALKQIVAQMPFLQASLGNVLQVRLVVDANFVVGELIQRVRHPERGPTAFEELVRATVIDVFAPRWLDTEMSTSAIPKAAKRSRVSESALRAQWAKFQNLLKWDESLCGPDLASSTCCDPKDLPYVRLQQKLGADGILTKDAHINRMGGHSLTLDFVFNTRAYARSAVTTVSIRFLGAVLPSVSLIILARFLKQLAGGFVRLPEPIKTLIIIGGITAMASPVCRRWIAARCRDAFIALAPTLEALPDFISSLAKMSAAAEIEASSRRREVLNAIRPRSPALSPTTKRRARHVGGASEAPAVLGRAAG